MTPLMLEAFASLRPIEISACTPCHLFWFDKLESIRLTPRSVLEVFQFIGRSAQARNPLKSEFACPICSKALALTYDLQRATRFTYWRCRNDHGQLITFHHFLREKNFIRAPSADELALLEPFRAKVPGMGGIYRRSLTSFLQQCVDGLADHAARISSPGAPAD